jgi:hypothetical protein
MSDRALWQEFTRVEAELAEAIKLLRKVQVHGYFTEQHNVDAFLMRHAPAEAGDRAGPKVSATQPDGDYLNPIDVDPPCDKETPARQAHSKSEYKRLTALGVDCTPPKTR